VDFLNLVPEIWLHGSKEDVKYTDLYSKNNVWNETDTYLFLIHAHKEIGQLSVQ
jgi:hypothetical protein